MSSPSLRLLLPLSALLVLVGCGGDACPALSLGMDSLAAQAAAIEIAVYADPATCDGSDVAAGAPSPRIDRRIDGHAGTVVDLPPGHYVVVLHAFDAGGALLGSACQAELFTPGQKACVAVTLSPVGDGGSGDDDLGGGSDGMPPATGDMARPPFVAQASGVTSDLYQVWSPGGGVAFVVGPGGVVLHTADSGATWTKQTSNTTQTLEAVWGSSATDVYAAGLGATVIHTSDGGATWKLMTVPESPAVGFYDVWGTGAADVYVSGDKGQVLHGSLGSWTVLNLGGTAVTINDVWGSSATDVYLFGANGTIFHGSASAGFTKQSAGTTDYLNYGWGNGDGSDVWINALNSAPMTTIYHTGDHGKSWVGQLSTSATLWAIWSSASGDAFAVGDQILETTDHGAHWTSALAAPPQLLYGVGGDSNGTAVWAVGKAGTILYRP